MKDTVMLVAAGDSLFASGDEGVLVTLVHTEGSTYRRPGARMLVLPGCRTVGTLSGGCLESAIAREAWTLTRGTTRAAFWFESAPEDDSWGPASGCHGRLLLIAERIFPKRRHPALERLASVRESHEPTMFMHVLVRGADGEFGADQSDIEAGGGGEERWKDEAGVAFGNKASRWVVFGGGAVFLEYLQPPTHLLLCGAGDDAQPVARIASELAWSVDVVDTRGRSATRERFPTVKGVHVGAAENVVLHVYPHSAAILMSHRFVDDVEFLGRLVQGDVVLPYIGILGPRRRTERLLAELASRGLTITERRMKSLRSPAGLDVGANSPETIALSIITEIQAFCAGRDAQPLCARTGAIRNFVSSAEPII